MPVVFNKLGMSLEELIEISERILTNNDVTAYPGMESAYTDVDGNDIYHNDSLFQSEEEFIERVSEIGNYFNNFPEWIPIYRVIQVDKLRDIKYGYDLGDCWSYEEHSALNFGQNNLYGKQVLLGGLVYYSNVDWLTTLNVFFQFSFFENGEEENEIHISDPSQITQVKILRKDKGITESIEYFNFRFV